MKLVFAGGNMAERLLRNRGKLRGICSSLNEKILKRTLTRFLSGLWQPEPVRMESNYAISLTSWRRRLDVLPLTLLSLIRQDVRAEAIHVSLAAPDIRVLPTDLVKAFSRHGVIFSETPDYRSHKKWLSLLLSGRERPFVVCDDDIVYPREWFGRLVAEDRQDAYVGCKCHRIVLGDRHLPAPYAQWERQVYTEKAPSHLLFTTGCGGEVLHPERIGEEFRDWKRIAELCPNSDDVWLKAAHLNAGVPVFKTEYCFPCLELPGTDATGLALDNDAGGKDHQIAAVEAQFRLISDLDCKSGAQIGGFPRG